VIYEREQAQATQQSAKAVTVLVIDGEKAIRRFLYTALSAYGYDVHEAATGQEGVFQIVSLQPDLTLLDIDLPDTNGVEITKTIREWSKMPILILSAHDQDADKIEALDAGADDYIVKPFSIGELMARMRAALRHVSPIVGGSTSVFSGGDLLIDLTARTVKVRDQYISLTPIEYELLRTLVNHAGKVMTHQQLWRAIRSEDGEAEPHLIRVHMSNLRRKLEADPTDPQYVMTEPGVGYRLRLDL
jgi:two-component system KDP operon response regulator KdpE